MNARLTQPRQPSAGYPPLLRGPHEEIRHGVAIPDPYRALEMVGGGADNGDAEAVRAWLAAQRDHARQWLDSASARGFFEHTVRELSDLRRRGVPAARDTGLFFTEQAPGMVSPSLYVERPQGTSRLVDPADWGTAASARITAWSVSPDGSRLAFQICDEGLEHGPLRVLDVASGEVVLVVAEDVRNPSVAWGGSVDRPPNGLYYPRAGSGREQQGLYFVDFESGRHTEVWLPAETDRPVFTVPAVSPDGAWLLLTVRYGADPRNALLIAPVNPAAPERAEPQLLVKSGQSFTAARFGPDGRIYCFTHLRSSLGQVCVFDPADPDPASWRELTAGGGGTVIRTFAPLYDRVAVCRSVDGRAEVLVVHADSGRETLLPLPDGGTVSAMTGSTGPDNRLWITFADPTQPPAVLEFDLSDPPAGPGAAAGEAAAPRARDWFRPANPCLNARIRAERTVCRSADGTEIPISTLTNEDGPPGPGPVILSVYGGFGITADRAFSAETLSWLLAGGSHAVAHVRGGGEAGATWHAAGRGRNKPRSVEDLIAAAEHLVASGRTTSDQLVLFGASNGGMLAAAAAVRRPDLFRACVAVHPVTDMVRFTLLGDGPAWVTEYGDPADEADLTALRSYSPYHNVRPGVRYPAFLVMAGTSDRRVPPAHARKLCAALQHATSGDRREAPVLLREQEGAGHGVIPQDQVLPWLVDRLSFMARCTALDPGRTVPSSPSGMTSPTPATRTTT
ncbi:prolyl oligopeptidase family serine peptidase [Kitasatospora sp. HPMI-4]|uniref:prolyl oligopeptidase family serine peptidase n=1 Tax=Kitasatospora sp. HPMI-4 TaxID=3448443 RepID=UPI003F1E4214